MTIIELILVVVIIALISVVLATRTGMLDAWQEQKDVRSIINTLELLFAQSQAQNESYRIIFDIDNNTSQVLREIPLRTDDIVEVDLLSNLRTKGEQERRKEEEQDKFQELETFYAAEEERLNDSLDLLFYETMFSDTENIQLTPPPAFPGLAQKKELSSGLKILRIQLFNETFESGEAIVRFRGSGAASFLVIYLQGETEIYTIHLDPTTGRVSSEIGEKSFDWNS